MSTSLKASGSFWTGTIVLITGCSRGLGLGLVEHLLERGAVVIATCRTPDRADALRAVLEARGAAAPVQLDTSDEASMSSLPARLAELGINLLDVLINNAGISNPGASSASSLSELEIRNAAHSIITSS